jgi:hypothetical protein
MENTDLQIQGTDDFKNITVFFFVEYIPEDGRKRPKYVRGLPYIYILLSLIIVSGGSAVG